MTNRSEINVDESLNERDQNKVNSLGLKGITKKTDVYTDELLNACEKNDRTAQGILYRNLSPVLYPICLRYSSDKDKASDYLHDTFITIYRKIKTFKRNGSFEGWAKRIAMNTALMDIRKHRKLVFKEKVKQEEVLELESNEVERIKLNVILEFISELPDGCRAVFNMYELDGFKHSEIAKELKISEGTSKSQLFKARKLLKEMIITYERGLEK